ncbi:hypothetical protein BYT27DRAFT_7194995 [Phlegmacium glaucopus]|nr:hypothetical protein BYT27DRAFT_7194995 [Phlegmacium glaucopus]
MTYESKAEILPPVREPSPPHNRVTECFEQLRGEIITIMHSDNASREMIRRLETELEVYKRAYADLDAELRRVEMLKLEADKQKEDLENQLKGHRIITLLDGDGAIFNPQIISQGQAGGHSAAQKLSDTITHHLTSTVGTNHYQLWVYIFLNKRGLLETFGRVGLSSAKAKFEEFILGFNQAAERFIMVDVGGAKEAADAKIKALLEDEIKLPQTEKIIFGGCHDNGYATTLRSQITAGFKQKLILLRGYAEMAVAINELELPSFHIPDLFIPQKLGVAPSPKQNSVTLAPLPTAIPTPPLYAEDGNNVSNAYLHELGLEALPFTSFEPEMIIPKQRSSYSSAVQAAPKRAATPELDSNGSSVSTDESEDALRRSPTISKSRLVNPNLPLSKHNPPPCTLFYLSNCKHGVDCKYGHNYLLQPEHFAEIRVSAKKSPCPSRNKGEVCAWGDDCCYGHNCPLTTKCHFLKQGRCKFVGVDMHKEDRR